MQFVLPLLLAPSPTGGGEGAEGDEKKKALFVRRMGVTTILSQDLIFHTSNNAGVHNQNETETVPLNIAIQKSSTVAPILFIIRIQEEPVERFFHQRVVGYGSLLEEFIKC